MKKISMVFLLLIGLAAVKNNASAQIFEQGGINANLGIGFGGGFGIPIGISAEYGMTDKIGVGGFLGYASESEDFGTFKAKYSYILVGARANYHFTLSNDKIDPYAGILLGYNAASVTLDPDPGPPFNNITAGGVVYGVHAGARYMFTEKLGAFAEVGYGLGSINLGVTAKF